jgi:hypothetical protein
VTDDAVAPVIAVMLILAVAATAVAIFNGVYIPSLKQEAEIEHLRTVESSFQHFSSDIERAVSEGNDRVTVSEPVQLGGGDVFLNPLRSGGSLTVMNEEDPVCTVSLYDSSGTLVGEMNSTLVNISYEPSGNFWQDQGYRWQYGYLNVTKYGGKRQGPLGSATMTEVENGFNGTGTLAAFAKSFGRAEYTVNRTLYQNMTPTPDNRFAFTAPDGVCSRIELRAVNLSTSPGRSFSSGNGFGRLGLESRRAQTDYPDIIAIKINSSMGPFGNATFRNWNESFTAMARDCRNNIEYVDDPLFSGEGFSVFSVRQQVSPVNVTLRIVAIGAGAY